MLTFEPMSEEDLAAFIRKSIPEYAYDQTRSGNWLANEAVGKARAEFSQMLPDGLQTPNAHLRTILDEDGKKIGMLWYYIDPSRSLKTAFLIDFFLFSEARHRGFEEMALQVFEKEAGGMGVERVELQVFAHKTEDLKLYHENAYQDTSVVLGKNLKKAEGA